MGLYQSIRNLILSFCYKGLWRKGVKKTQVRGIKAFKNLNEDCGGGGSGVKQKEGEEKTKFGGIKAFRNLRVKIQTITKAHERHWGGGREETNKGHKSV